MVVGEGMESSDVSYADGRPVFRMVCDNGRVMHFVMCEETLSYLICDKDGGNAKSYRVQIVPA